MQDELKTDVRHIIAVTEFSFTSIDEARRYLAGLSRAHIRLITSITLDSERSIRSVCSLGREHSPWPDHNSLVIYLPRFGDPWMMPYKKQPVENVTRDAISSFLADYPHIERLLVDFRMIWWRTRSPTIDASPDWPVKFAKHACARSLDGFEVRMGLTMSGGVVWLWDVSWRLNVERNCRTGDSTSNFPS